MQIAKLFFAVFATAAALALTGCQHKPPNQKPPSDSIRDLSFAERGAHCQRHCQASRTTPGKETDDVCQNNCIVDWIHYHSGFALQEQQALPPPPLPLRRR